MVNTTKGGPVTKTVTPRDVADYWRRWALHLGEGRAGLVRFEDGER